MERNCAAGVGWFFCAILFTALFVAVGSADAQSRAVTSVKLFDATRTTGRGPNTSINQAVPFATQSFVLTKEAGDLALLSSTPDGTGKVVIDNFLTINGKNVCEGASGQLYFESCFGRILNPKLPLNESIETVLEPVPAIDVAVHIPVGTSSVVFELRDFGSLAGNTDLYFVTTSKRAPAPLSAVWNGSTLVVTSTAPQERNANLRITVQRDNLQAIIGLQDRPLVQIAQEISSLASSPHPLSKARFSPTVLGVNAAFEVDRFLLTGQVADRPIVPLPVAPGSVIGETRFLDSQAPPPVRVSDEDLAALAAFAANLETQLPAMTPALAASCRDQCILDSCKAAMDKGVPLMLNPNVQPPRCTGSDSALEEYRQEFNQCFETRCSLLGVIISEGAGSLPYRIGRILEAAFDITTRRRRR